MTSSSDIQREIAAKIRKDAEVRLKSKKAAEEIRDEVRAEAPVRTGKFVASIHVEKHKDRGGMPAFTVISRSPLAHLIEYGTGPDPADTHSRFGRDTPTPEFAPFAKVAHRHGGTLDGGIEAGE